jgi:two-component system nitrate/nitrite response regulator NarL
MHESRRIIHILIASDHALFRATLKKLFDSEKGFLIAGEACEGEEALHLVELLKPDILLLDRRLLLLSGMDILRSLSAFSIKTQTIMLTSEIELDQVPEAFQLGARGLVLKESGPEMLFLGIRSVMAGYYWLGGERYKGLEQILKKLADRAPLRKRDNSFGLTQRELKIVVAVSSGFTNKEIAQQLSLSVETVKHHLTNIFDKLGVYSRLELTLFALHHNLTKESD